MASKTSYSVLQIGLHWATASLIAANYFISEGMGEALDAHLAGEPVIGLVPVWHVWAGTLLLVLVVARLIVRFVTGAPKTTEQPTLAQRAAEIGHWVLYAVMLAVPALGAITWFGMTDSTGDLHVLVMNALMLLILGHAAMAIFHHYVLVDKVLSKISPLR